MYHPTEGHQQPSSHLKLLWSATVLVPLGLVLGSLG